jgi:hypothetical protein
MPFQGLIDEVSELPCPPRMKKLWDARFNFHSTWFIASFEFNRLNGTRFFA